MNDVGNDFEIPKIEEQKENESKEIFSSVFVPESKVEVEEEEEIELPTLKKDIEKENNNTINDIQLNDLTGEIYKINK